MLKNQINQISHGLRQAKPLLVSSAKAHWSWPNLVLRLVVKTGHQVLQKVVDLALSTPQVRTKSQDPWVLCMPPHPLPSSQLRDEGSPGKSRVCIGTWKRSAVCQPFSVYLPFSQTFWWQVAMFCVSPSLLHSLNWSRYTTQRNKVLATYRAKCYTACWQSKE